MVADLPAGAHAVELVVQAPSATQRARVRLQAAWVVGLPETITDLARTAPAAPPAGPPLPSGTSVILRDGCLYGPATLRVPVGGNAPEARRLEWPVDLPQAPAVLRGLFGLPATAPPDGGVTVVVTLIAGEQTWALVQNLTIAGDLEDGWPAIIETAVPPEARGRACRIVMDVSTKDRRAANLAVPYLCVCRG